jgi:hypothetical protein
VQEKEGVVMVTVPEVTGVDPALTRAGLTLPGHPVSTTDGSERVVVVGMGHAPLRVIGSATESPLDTSVTLTVPAAVAPQATVSTGGSIVVKVPPPFVKQIGFGPP